LTSAGINFLSMSPKRDLLNVSQDSSPFQRRQTPTSLQGSFLKVSTMTPKNVSFVDDQFSTFTASTCLPDKESCKNDEDTGDLSEADIQIENCNVKAFMDSHCIQISMKNPGKL